MSFTEKLSKEQSRDGWTHNPWGAPDSPDAVATRIANRYIRAITDELLKMGYMPLTGVEVNFLSAPVPPEEVVNHIKGATFHHRRSIVKREVGPLSRALQTKAVDEMKAILKEMEILPRGMDKEQSTARMVWQGWLKNILLPMVKEQGIASCCSGGDLLGLLELQEIREYLNYYPDDHAVRRLSACVDSLLEDYKVWEKEWRKKRDKYRDGAIAINEDSKGRIYVDSNIDVELATEIGSPMATVARAHAIQKTAWEVGGEYERQWQDYLKEIGGAYKEAPRSQAAQTMRDQMPLFDVFFRAVNNNCAQHLNISLWRTTFRDYVNPKKVMKHSKNLVSSNFWQEMIVEALIKVYPADTLLALGNDDLLAMRRPAHECGTSKPNRVEVRTYSDATSNISLTMLATLAGVYALVKTMRALPNMESGGLRGALRHEDKVRILKAMKEKYGLLENLPKTKEQALDAFQERSVTLSVMRELAATYEPQPGREEKAPLSPGDADIFRKAAIARVERLERCREL